MSRRSGSAPTAVVLGGAGTEVARPLQLARIPTAVIPPPNDPVRYSRRVQTLFDWDWSAPPEAHDESLLERLIAWGRTQPERPVLFYCWDSATIFVSRYRERLAEYFRFIIPDADLVNATADKGSFASLADRLALPVPATVVIPPGTKDIPTELSHLGWPLILKPELRDRRWRHATNSHAKALLVESAEQLSALWAKLGGCAQPLIAQQYIPGAESAIESYHVYVDATGEVAAEFTGKKIRTYPVDCGSTTALAITYEQDVLQLGRKLVEQIGLRGIAKLDFKRTQNGELYLLEVNARASLWVHPGTRAGINLLAMAYADLTGTQRPPLVSPARPTTWVHPKDVLAARAAGMSLPQWLRFAARCQSKAVWSWSDPMPLIGTMASRLRRPGWT